MLKALCQLACVGALCYGAWWGYERWQADRSTLDLGLSALQSGDYEQAVVMLERARQEEPENVGIALHLASAYDKAGDPRRAVSAYESAESLLNDPDQSVSMRRHRERFAILKGQVGE